MTNNPKIGVIDIGSNSIRLVIYEKSSRVLLPYYQEKAICKLGSALEANGNFSSEAKTRVMKVISRLVTIAKLIRVGDLVVIATAAFRIAQDGKDFAAEIGKKFGVNIKIVSGEEEAILAAEGVFYAFPNAQGIVIDLGGGSLEIAYISQNIVTKSYSWNLGLLRLQEIMKKQGKSYLENYIEEELSDLKLVEYSNQALFLVGGGFRYLAKLHMRWGKYPLSIVNNYQLSLKSFSLFLEGLEKESLEDSKNFIEDSSRRETLLESVVLSRLLVKILQPEKFIFCAYGIREGIVFSSLSNIEKSKDPLFAGCKDLIHEEGDSNNNSDMLFQWVKQIFICRSEQFNRIIKACCILYNIARFDHTEYRAEVAFHKTIDSVITGITHKERAFIACCLFHRYKAKDKQKVMNNILKILNKGLQNKAKTLGITLKLAQVFSAGAITLLDNFQIFIDKNKKLMVFKVRYQFQDLISESVVKYIRLLSKEFNLEANIDYFN